MSRQTAHLPPRGVRKWGILRLCLCTLVSAIHLPGATVGAQPETDTTGSRPNVIIVFTDDQGYGDLGVYGTTGFDTPHLDRMAAEGIRFTDFYVAAAVCTPSRAALLTGRHPMRVGLANRVLFPYSRTGLHLDEQTIAEILKPLGYATGAIGKWHLGHHSQFLPTRQGFDTYFGIPYSNDMGDTLYGGPDEFVSPPLPLMRNEFVVEENPAQTELTRRYTEEAVEFIESHKDRPFFLYLAHSMPHLPIAPSEAFRGRSGHGLYGDVISEIDWSVGQILGRLKELGLDDNTWVIFSSDNGPRTWGGEAGWVWTSDDHGRPTRGKKGFRYRSGSAGPLRGNKNTTWEGGMRVPGIMRWPSRIPAGVVTHQLATSMDLLPTIAAVTGARLPSARPIDGKDISTLIFDPEGASSPHIAFYYYLDERLQAVRSGIWKLHLYRPEWENESPRPTNPLLFNLETDVGETIDRAAEFPDVVQQLQALAEAARASMGDRVTGQAGSQVAKRLDG